MFSDEVGVIITMSLNSKNVLITGATGFIGYHLTKKLLAQNCNVIAIGRNFKLLNMLPKNKLLIKINGDLIKENFLINLFSKHRIDILFHLAAKVHERSEKDVKQYRLVNVNLTEKLAELALNHNVERLVYFSSVSVYGDTEGRIINENGKYTPSTTYGKTKLEAENLLIKSWQKFNLPVTVLRLTSVYGTYDHGNMKLLSNIIRKHLSVMVGQGKNRKTMIYIDDVIQAAIFAAIRDEAVGEVFNVGENSYTFCEILDTIEKALRVSTFRFKIPLFLEKIIERQKISVTLSSLLKTLNSDNCYSTDKAKKILGFKPMFNLEQGLKESIEWYRSN